MNKYLCALILFAGQSNIGLRSSWHEEIVVPNVAHRFSTNAPDLVIQRQWIPLATYGEENLFAADLSYGIEMQEGEVIKFSRGGTNMHDWRRSLFDEMMRFVNGAEIDTFIWMQGGGDAQTEELARSYGNNLNWLRRNVGARRFILTLMHVDAQAEFANVVRAEQEEFALRADVYAVNIDDLQLNKDNLHFTADAQMEIGRRLFAVPEPATSVLLIVAAIVILIFVNRKPRS